MTPPSAASQLAELCAAALVGQEPLKKHLGILGILDTMGGPENRVAIFQLWIDAQQADTILLAILKPLFGDSEVCLLDGYAVTGIGKRSQCSNDHFEWASEFVPRYKYIAAQMVLAADSTEERIGWLWERWKEAKRDEG